jgi:hypothetical protein
LLEPLIHEGRQRGEPVALFAAGRTQIVVGDFGSRGSIRAIVVPTSISTAIVARGIAEVVVDDIRPIAQPRTRWDNARRGTALLRTTDCGAVVERGFANVAAAIGWDRITAAAIVAPRAIVGPIRSVTVVVGTDAPVASARVVVKPAVISVTPSVEIPTIEPVCGPVCGPIRAPVPTVHRAVIFDKRIVAIRAVISVAGIAIVAVLALHFPRVHATQIGL